ncbi:13333_t:CDS:1, partial [Gigaspora margarita]
QVPTCQKKKFSTKVPSPKTSPNKTDSNEKDQPDEDNQNVNQRREPESQTYKKKYT